MSTLILLALLLPPPVGADAGRATCQPTEVFFDDFELTRSTPAYYDRALRNPMKGFTHSIGHPWASTRHVYFRWNELENREADGLERILQVSHQQFAAGPASNVKFIPRVYLHWSQDDQKYWPEDMQTDDYSSPQFQARVTRLVQRLGQAWNNDPRVAFVELGIFGKWGEHHSPSPTAEMQRLVGQAFRAAFPDKKVSVRHAWSEFPDLGMGVYWDSWGHYQQMWGHGYRIAELNRSQQLYLSTYIGGEVAYDWGEWQRQPGLNPTASVANAVHRDFLINTIRWLHGTQLRWISAYDQNDPAARAGAEQLQRVMGYRFVLDRVGFDAEVGARGMRVELAVRNEGSAPFYYNWPVEVALHHPGTRAIVWKSTFSNLDIRRWTPGSDWTPPQFETIALWPQQAIAANWSNQPLGWGTPPATHRVAQTFRPEVAAGEYVLSVAVLDPAGMQPSLRFASRQYWNGGRHPIGRVAIGQTGGGTLPANFAFDDPALDASLRYVHP